MAPPGPRLDDDVSRMLERARALARQHQHETVELEHLLAAAFACDPSLAFEGIARDKLVALLDGRIATRPGVAIYRDARSTQAPALSPAVNLALRRAASAYDPNFGLVTPHKLFSELCLETSLESLIEDARIDVAELDALLDEAHELAVSRGHELVTVHHVLAAAQTAEWFATGIAACSADAAKLSASLESRLDGPRKHGQPRLSVEVAQIVELVKNLASVSGQGAIGGVDFVVHLLKDRYRADVFAEAGVPEQLLLRWFASGHIDAGDDASDSDGEQDLEVVLHDDTATTMLFVVEVLESAFGCSRDRAEALMRAVHASGDMVVGRYPAAEARARVATTRAMAEKAWMPLRISVRPAPSK